MPYTILAAVFLLFLGLCWMLPLNFRLYYRRQGANDHFIIDTTALGNLIRYRLKIPVNELTRGKNGFPWVDTEIESRGGERLTDTAEEQTKSWAWLRFALENYDEVMDKIHRLLGIVNDYSDFMRWVTSGVRFQRFYWVTRIGLEDAAATAVLTGGCWAVKSCIAASLWHRHCCSDAGPVIQVIPVYNQEVFHTDFECIFSVRLGHIIGAGIRLLRYKI